jgi:hypothetical protein
MHAHTEESRSLTLLDLPKAVLQDILSRCGPGETRCLGIAYARTHPGHTGAYLRGRHTVVRVIRPPRYSVVT